MKEGAALQFDMFTGALVDNRTAEQKRRDSEVQTPTQLLMFSQRDIGQMVNPYPRMDVSPGRLALIAEDPRTPEQIDRDLELKAQQLTTTLFPPEAAAPNLQTNSVPVDQTDTVGQGEDDEDEAEPTTPEPPPSKYETYLHLVNLAQEDASTIYQTVTAQLAQSINLSLAKFRAGRAGLRYEEITAAITIGQVRGKALLAAATAARRTTPIVPPEQTEPTTSAEAASSDADIPILWLNRADLIERRPDLTDAILRLRDYEVEHLASLVGDALEEFYWIQLNVVLSLYLDHDLALHLKKNVR